MSDKVQLHQSMIGTAARCWLQFIYRYGYLFEIHDREIIRPPNFKMVVGSAAHAGFEKMNRVKIAGAGAEPELLDASVESGVNHYDAVWDKKEIRLWGDEKNIKVTRGKGRDMTVELVKKYYTDIYPIVQPIDVEVPFVIELDNFDFDLAGRIDLDEGKSIRDSKTSGMRPPKHAARSLQMSLYSMYKALETKKETGVVTMPEKVAVDYLYYTKTKAGFNYHSQTFEAVPDQSWIKPLYNRILQMAETLDACKRGKIDPLKAAPPADPSPLNYVCSAKYCGYYDICPAWSGRED
jgi:hypothetical protein